MPPGRDVPATTVVAGGETQTVVVSGPRLATADTGRCPRQSGRGESCLRPTDAGFDQSGFVRTDCRLDAVAQVELAQDMRYVRLHRRLGEKEPHRNLCVGQAATDEPEHLAFASGELGKLRLLVGVRALHE